MHRIDSNGATVDNKFKGTPVPATIISSAWLNAIQEELAKVITDPTGGNVALSKPNNGQLLAAIIEMIGRAIEDTVEVTAGATGQIAILGVIIKWGGYRSTVTSETTIAVNFATAFPASCWRVLTTPVVSSFSTSQDLWVQLVGPSVTETGFTVQTQADESGDQLLAGFDWIAIGN